MPFVTVPLENIEVMRVGSVGAYREKLDQARAANAADAVEPSVPVYDTVGSLFGLSAKPMREALGLWPDGGRVESSGENNDQDEVVVGRFNLLNPGQVEIEGIFLRGVGDTEGLSQLADQFTTRQPARA